MEREYATIKISVGQQTMLLWSMSLVKSNNILRIFFIFFALA